MNWKIFIITHGPVRDDYYVNDPDFSYDNFVLFNVSDTPIFHSKFSIINANEMSGYKTLGKWYAESEVIYNLYICNLYKELDYIGFVHWDYELRSFDESIGYKVCKAISNEINKGTPFISFSTFDFEYAYNLNIMLDIDFPNQCYGTEGRNCFDEILAEYNLFYDKDVLIQTIFNRQINLCSAFLVNRVVFEDLMPFYKNVIEKGYLNYFDTNHNYRFQGGMMERYIGIYSAMIDMVTIPLNHHYNHKKEVTELQLRFEQFRKALFKNIKRLKRVVFFNLLNDTKSF